MSVNVCIIQNLKLGLTRKQLDFHTLPAMEFQTVQEGRTPPVALGLRHVVSGI